MLLLLLLDGGIRKILVVSGLIAARLLPLVHFLMAALFEDFLAFTLGFVTGVFTLGRVGSGLVAAAVLFAALLVIGVGSLAFFKSCRICSCLCFNRSMKSLISASFAES